MNFQRIAKAKAMVLRAHKSDHDKTVWYKSDRKRDAFHKLAMKLANLQKRVARKCDRKEVSGLQNVTGKKHAICQEQLQCNAATCKCNHDEPQEHAVVRATATVFRKITGKAIEMIPAHRKCGPQCCAHCKCKSCMTTAMTLVSCDDGNQSKKS